MLARSEKLVSANVVFRIQIERPIWRLYPGKEKGISSALDPCLLKLYFAGAATAIKVLRSLPTKVPFLFSAGLYWNNGKFNLSHPLDFASEIFMDSGAQQFYKRFTKLDYPYDSKEYLDFAKKVGADLVATLDLPLDILATRGLSIRKGIERTVEHGVAIFDHAEKIGIAEKIVPVIQGLDDPSQWNECLDLYKQHGVKSELRGLGSLCMAKSRILVKSVVKAMAERLPKKKMHVFGLALDALRETYSYIYSFDTSTWIYWAKMDSTTLLRQPVLCHDIWDC